MVNLKDIIGMLKTLPKRYRIQIVFIFIIGLLCFSYALKFYGLVQIILVLTGCFPIWTATIILFIVKPLISSRK